MNNIDNRYLFNSVIFLLCFSVKEKNDDRLTHMNPYELLKRHRNRLIKILSGCSIIIESNLIQISYE